eukprot:10062277-Alexandrium_andersonii.AAC.1
MVLLEHDPPLVLPKRMALRAFVVLLHGDLKDPTKPHGRGPSIRPRLGHRAILEPLVRPAS